MSKKINLLDCTLRDGAYIVDSAFGEPAIKGIINKLQSAEVEIVECGWLKNAEHKKGTTFYHVPDDLLLYIADKNPRVTYTVMIDWDRYDLDYLPPYDGKSVDAIRVVFPHGKYKEGIEIGKQIKAKGYQVFFQAANTLAYSEADLVELAKAINSVNPVSLSIVDTFGAMYESDLDKIVNVLDNNLNSNIKLGFHSHNNQQLSFSLSIHFVETLMKGNRGVVVDSSLCGMGRGAGNTTTELLVNYLNSKQNCNYDMNAIMDSIDIYMSGFQEKFSWGYSTPNFIAGMYCCHVNNIAYLLNNHRTNSKDMKNIIESLPPENRKKYDYDLLEEKYLENQNRSFDDVNSINLLKKIFANKSVLLIAPGKSAVQNQDKIKAYIERNEVVVIAVNALLQEFDYDFLFLTNSARYEYAKETKGEQFEKCTKILLSNIKNKPGRNEIIIEFNHVIKRGWEHFDNAVICCLRLMERINVGNIVLAGFDGFKNVYNESYADESLPTLNPGNKWNELNEEIRDMFQDFLKITEGKMTVSFLTESIYMN